MTAPRRRAEALSYVVEAVEHLQDDVDVVDLLDELTRHSAALLDVASSGLLLTDGVGRLHLMSSTSGRTTDLELFQLQQDEGPCLECFRAGRPVLVPDLAAARTRWPVFAAAAAAAGFASVHAVPMRAAGTVLGALGLFATTAGELAADDLSLAQTLAHLATIALVQQRPPAADLVLSRLTTALADRTVVEQARGFVSEVLDTDVDTALRLLREQARDDQERLTGVARALVVDGGRRTALLAELASRLG